jgi:hypothetical protein
MTVYKFLIIDDSDPLRSTKKKFIIFIFRSSEELEEVMCQFIEGDQNETLDKLANFICNIYPDSSLVWKIIGFALEPGCNISDHPFFTQLDSKIALEISKLKEEVELLSSMKIKGLNSERCALYIKELKMFWEKNKP